LQRVVVVKSNAELEWWWRLGLFEYAPSPCWVNQIYSNNYYLRFMLMTPINIWVNKRRFLRKWEIWRVFDSNRVNEKYKKRIIFIDWHEIGLHMILLDKFVWVMIFVQPFYDNFLTTFSLILTCLSLSLSLLFLTNKK
jgi:hypothetical protein